MSASAASSGSLRKILVRPIDWTASRPFADATPELERSLPSASLLPPPAELFFAGRRIASLNCIESRREWTYYSLHLTAKIALSWRAGDYLLNTVDPVAVRSTRQRE